jgi:hypothetical protein
MLCWWMRCGDTMSMAMAQRLCSSESLRDRITSTKCRADGICRSVAALREAIRQERRLGRSGLQSTSLVNFPHSSSFFTSTHCNRPRACTSTALVIATQHNNFNRTQNMTVCHETRGRSCPRFCGKQLAILGSSSLDLSQDGWNGRNKHDHARDWSRLERGIYQWSREHIYTASKSAHGIDLCRSKEQAV